MCAHGEKAGIFPPNLDEAVSNTELCFPRPRSGLELQ